MNQPIYNEGQTVWRVAVEDIILDSPERCEIIEVIGYIDWADSIEYEVASEYCSTAWEWELRVLPTYTMVHYDPYVKDTYVSPNITLHRCLQYADQSNDWYIAALNLVGDRYGDKAVLEYMVWLELEKSKKQNDHHLSSL